MRNTQAMNTTSHTLPSSQLDPLLAEHQVVSREAWTEARKELLQKEKEHTRRYDALCAQRRGLPWVRMDKAYAFEGPHGTESLSDLFDGRSQLMIQHFMMGPGWKEGCTGCSFLADHIDGARLHLEPHDVTVVAVSRATYPEIASFKKRMGWQFKWVSSHGSDFNYDFNVSFTPKQIAEGRAFYNYAWSDTEEEESPGISVFYRDAAGTVYHTYSAFSRGQEQLVGAYNFLDLTPKGRNENGPNLNLMDWVKHHDRYQPSSVSTAGCCCRESGSATREDSAS
jgi:predicted dithiol-disulfide oxidoreductase (DUF899 family)